MDDTEKLIVLADACSDALLGGERGWEEMDFKSFVSECRKAICQRHRLINAGTELVYYSDSVAKILKDNGFPGKAEALEERYMKLNAVISR